MAGEKAGSVSQSRDYDGNCPDGAIIKEAVNVLSHGGVVVYPTETVYGLAADATNEEAIARVFAIKGRDFQKPLPLICHAEEQVDGLVRSIPPYARRLMDVFWPGPLTIIFWAHPEVSPILTAGSGKIGVRISAHTLARSLAAAFGKPITATSANIAGMPECRSVGEVLQQLGNAPDLLLDGGRLSSTLASTIIDVTGASPLIVRAGAIPPDAIFAKLPPTTTP